MNRVFSRPSLARTLALATVLLLASLAGAVAASSPASGSGSGGTSSSKSTPKTPTKSGSSTKATPAPAPAAKSTGIARNPYLGAIVIDAATGRVLFEEGADVRAYPASVLKLMDLLIVLETIQGGRLSLTDPVTVSARAATTGGSQVWLAEKEVFTVEELLYALMIQSANDAAVALAEKVAGSTEAFVDLMNRRARELGMQQTTFHSVHGLPPGKGQQPDVTTPRDFALLCRAVLRHPQALGYTSTRERAFRPAGGPKMVLMRTHNHLLADLAGCDGLKTGYYTVAGFSIAATASRNGQRVVAVVMGSTDRKVRDERARQLIERGFSALGSSPVAANPPTAAVPPLPPGTATRPAR